MPGAAKKVPSKESKVTKQTSKPMTSEIKKDTTKKEVKSTVVEEPVVPVVVESVPDVVMENEVELKSDDDISQSFSELMKKLSILTTTFASLKQDFKTLEKRYAKEMKQVNKEKDKRKKNSNKPRQPSGFVKPTNISQELAVFLGKQEGTQMARTEVTREINKYIRNNDLQDKSNGRKINPDDKLRVLLQVPTDDDLTYFNLQKYLSKHFPKAVVVAESS